MNTPEYFFAISILFPSIFHKCITVSVDLEADNLLSVGKLKLKILEEGISGKSKEQILKCLKPTECPNYTKTIDEKTSEVSYTMTQMEISDDKKSTEITKGVTANENLTETEYTGVTNEPNSTEISEDVKHKGEPKDCSEVKEAGSNTSGIYTIFPVYAEINSSIEVYCDMETDGGGWTVIQRRGNYGKPQDYFYKTWKQYKIGFGNINEDFWLGNDNIHALTNQGNCSLRIDMKDWEGETAYAYYREFWIENEKQLYKLHVSGYSGTAGDSLGYHNGMKFSTRDMKNDRSNGNCATYHKGAWWYNSCLDSNLNGIHLGGSQLNGIVWNRWRGSRSLREVDMKIRSA